MEDIEDEEEERLSWLQLRVRNNPNGETYKKARENNPTGRKLTRLVRKDHIRKEEEHDTSAFEVHGASWLRIIRRTPTGRLLDTGRFYGRDMGNRISSRGAVAEIGHGVPVRRLVFYDRTF